MGDAPARTELKVTTGPIRGSRKILVGNRNVAMRAVAVPAGDHVVAFRYRPAGFRYGVILALVGALALGGRAAVPRLAGRRARA